MSWNVGPRKFLPRGGPRWPRRAEPRKKSRYFSNTDAQFGESTAIQQHGAIKPPQEPISVPVQNHRTKFITQAVEAKDTATKVTPIKNVKEWMLVDPCGMTTFYVCDSTETMTRMLETEPVDLVPTDMKVLKVLPSAMVAALKMPTGSLVINIGHKQTV